ncbi:hypothetical protein [Bacillus inaquosorum]|uniref:hypothetical protein n=1 Tax=Bacillus inaquosorum TaxID=483913 RepID=UPI00105C799F|nr:hypothetical protein [Bacillus inaquosorum]MCY8871283.1 hypothetical protein [Bacillus inaquosorum]MCY8996777.1 hypothetical protein [Bacillus inaquosorum]TDO08410.1 hypothetical protein DFO69_3812 [Bacillus subtilis]
MTIRKELIKQIILTITAIKTINQKNPTPMVKNILQRYEEASEEKFEEDFYKIRNKIDTLTRAYLESANDYMTPMLREMHKTEKIVKSLRTDI